MAEDDIKESILSEDVCDICNGELKNIAVIKKCFHFFCLPCLQQYSDVTNKCPTCSKEYTYFLSNITGDLKGKVNRVKAFDECLICLDGFRNKAKLDSCDHEYCFECIRNWSNVQNGCPACRQPFGAIFYNFRSEYDYDVHLVTLRDEESTDETTEQNEESSDETTEQNEQFEDQPDEHNYPHHSQISEPSRPTLPTARGIAPSIVTNFNHSNFGGFDIEFNRIGFPVYRVGINDPPFGVLPPAYDQNTHFTDVQYKPAVESRINANASSANNNAGHSATHIFCFGDQTSSAFELEDVFLAPVNLSTNNTAHSANHGFRFGSRLDSSDTHNPLQSTRSMTSSAFGSNGVNSAPVNLSTNSNTVHSANRGFHFGSRLDSSDTHNSFRSTRSMTSSDYRHQYFSPAPANSTAEAGDGSRSTTTQDSIEQLTDGIMNSAHKIPSFNSQDVFRKPLWANISNVPSFSAETYKLVPAPAFQGHFQANLPSDIAQPLPPPQGLVARLPRRSHLDPSFHPYNISHSFQNAGNHDS